MWAHRTPWLRACAHFIQMSLLQLQRAPNISTNTNQGILFTLLINCSSTNFITLRVHSYTLHYTVMFRMDAVFTLLTDLRLQQSTDLYD